MVCSISSGWHDRSGKGLSPRPSLTDGMPLGYKTITEKLQDCRRYCISQICNNLEATNFDNEVCMSFFFLAKMRHGGEHYIAASPRETA